MLSCDAELCSVKRAWNIQRHFTVSNPERAAILLSRSFNSYRLPSALGISHRLGYRRKCTAYEDITNGQRFLRPHSSRN